MSERVECIVHGVGWCQCFSGYNVTQPTTPGERFSVGLYVCVWCGFQVVGDPGGWINDHTHPGCDEADLEFRGQYPLTAV